MFSMGRMGRIFTNPVFEVFGENLKLIIATEYENL